MTTVVCHKQDQVQQDSQPSSPNLSEENQQLTEWLQEQQRQPNTTWQHGNFVLRSMKDVVLRPFRNRRSVLRTFPHPTVVFGEESDEENEAEVDEASAEARNDLALTLDDFAPSEQP